MNTEKITQEAGLNPAATKPETKPFPAPEAGHEDAVKSLERQCTGLRRLLSIALLLGLIFSMSVNLYLYRQMRSAGTDLTNLKPQVEALRTQHQQQQPAVDGFLRNLVAFGRSHPDFNPILIKHGILPANTASDIGVPTRPMD